MSIWGNKNSAGAACVGLDIGSRRAKIVVVGRGEGGERVLQHASVLELKGAASAATDIKDMWERATGHVGGCHCNLGPAGVIVQQVEFPVMQWKELLMAARVEAELLIPDIQNMVLDFQPIGERLKAEDKTLVSVGMIVAAPRQAVEERTALLAQARVHVLSMMPDGIALANAVQSLKPPDDGAVIVLDVGADQTSLVVVFPDKNIVAPIVRSIQGGTSLLESESPPPDKAASVEERDREGKRERWLREVERSIGFVSDKLGAPAQRLLVVGDGAASQMILSWLGQNVQVPVSPWNPLEDLKQGPGAPDKDFIRQWGSVCAVAAGLALGEGD